jgi:NADH dehydrogenase
VARHAVITGAFSFTGRFFARELLARGWTVSTLTNSSYPGDPLAAAVDAHPLDFADPAGLARAMGGADLFVNTFWIRYPHAGVTFESAVARTRVLLDAARSAKVGGVVQVGVVGAAHDSPHPYIRWKWHADEVLRDSGIPHAIVQPTLIFGAGDVLINNHAWLLRRVPLFFYAGRGDYCVQPVAGEDVATIGIELFEQGLRGQVVDAGGPEQMTYVDFVRLIRDAIGVRRPILPCPQPVLLATGALLGAIAGDRIVTRDELRALRAGTLCSNEAPNGTRTLAEWLDVHAADLGRRFVGRHTRHDGAG